MGKIVRDAVHGDIELSDIELELIDTPEFQRLRGIKQLGTASLIYPSALHTRFEHSLGTSWMARRIVQSIRRHHPVGDDELELIRVAALLHDVTHVPYGHTLEDERRVFPRHDEDDSRMEYFLGESSLGTILRRHGLEEEVRRILRGEAGYRSDIVVGAISADLLDYLRRDNYFTGLSQYFDDRVLSLFRREGDRLILQVERHGELRHDALSEMVHLLRIRYTLSERVYFHHTKLASGAMISRAVELALAVGFTATMLRTLRDETLLGLLRDRYAGWDEGIRHLMVALDARRLYKPCYMLTVDIGEADKTRLETQYHYAPAARAEAEAALASAAGLESWQVIVYCPSLGMSLPEADVPARMEAGQILPLSGANNAEIRILKTKHRALWKFLVLLDRTAWDRSERVGTAAAEYFGMTRESMTGASG
jgi:uncharacterized protein